MKLKFEKTPREAQLPDVAGKAGWLRRVCLSFDPTKTYLSHSCTAKVVAFEATTSISPRILPTLVNLPLAQL